MTNNNANIQSIPAYVITFAATLAADGVGLEDVQAKLVSVVKGAMAGLEHKVDKQGFAKVNKKLEMSESINRAYKSAVGTQHEGAMRFYRFCEHARKTIADFGPEATVNLPSDIKAWISERVSKMTPAIASAAPTPAPKAPTANLVTTP